MSNYESRESNKVDEFEEPEYLEDNENSSTFKENSQENKTSKIHISVECKYIHRRTKKSMLINFGTFQFWIPISQIKNAKSLIVGARKPQTVQVTEWFLNVALDQVAEAFDIDISDMED